MSVADIIQIPATAGLILVMALALVAVSDVFRSKRSLGARSRRANHAARLRTDV